MKSKFAGMPPAVPRLGLTKYETESETRVPCTSDLGQVLAQIPPGISR